MKQYKLLKDTATNDLGTIYTKKGDKKYQSSMYCRTIETLAKRNVENNPEWFEEVKNEFNKKFDIRNWKELESDECNDIDLIENFETIEQAEAMKEKRERMHPLEDHIMKFEEPKKVQSHFYLEVVEKELSFNDRRFYGADFEDFIGYNKGTIMNINTTKEDREERIRLLKKAYNI